MNEKKFTPGPWSVGGPTGYLNQVAIDPSIGCAYGAGEEVKANARLIAAAPDLLEALQTTALLLQASCMIFDPESRGIALEAVKEARAAIAKATGA
ncbi:hypothetical protein [Paraburkholderia unamae]|uniref:Uncharacterized protein n=1 Tax=Paraburkholderia unamae TaxID=219649 RepID=A0ABX5KFR9_9BURK|nr:hypothetical protein [Paraburkholderia unamae]PVX77204.1 hypothetical protein C7402_115263 [Paraburkholderia unamae]